jgi:hypothetical protein
MVVFTEVGWYTANNMQNVSQTEGPGNLFAKMMTIRKKQHDDVKTADSLVNK